MAFDYAGAKQAGYSDQEIQQYLTSKSSSSVQPKQDYQQNSLVSGMRALGGGGLMDLTALASELGRQFRKATGNFGMGQVEANPFISQQRVQEYGTPMGAVKNIGGDIAGAIAASPLLEGILGVSKLSGLSKIGGRALAGGGRGALQAMSANRYQDIPTQAAFGTVAEPILGKLIDKLPPSLSRKGIYQKMETATQAKEGIVPSDELFQQMKEKILPSVPAELRGEALKHIKKTIGGMAPARLSGGITYPELLAERSAAGKFYSEAQSLPAEVNRQVKRILSERLKQDIPEMKNLDQWYGIIAGMRKNAPGIAKSLAKLLGVGIAGKIAIGAGLEKATK